jgi:tRNA(adenine34) deaminase
MEEAWAAYCAGSLPIGACVTDAAGQILSRGRNRREETEGEAPYVHHNILAHAELNALLALQIPYPEREKAILFTTTEPCPLCMGAIYMSGVRTLHYAARESHAGSTNMLGTTPYLSWKPIKVFGPPDARLEAVVTALIVEVELASWRGAQNIVIPAWRGVIPQGVELGEGLYQSGELRGMREDRWRADQVVNTLIGRVSI